jgi:[ribosomal protein S5]-alanine N-acetyltransferase
VELETKRLILREWDIKDIEDLVEGLNNINVSKWLARIPYPFTVENAEYWINYCKEGAHGGQPRNSYEFAVELRAEKKVIGGVSLNKINMIHGTAGGGIWLNANYHGQGYGSEAYGMRIEFAFNELSLRRLENGFFEGNDPSAGMQEKLGYRIEGKRRKALRCVADGQYKDEYITGLLKEDWVQRKEL